MLDSRYSQQDRKGASGGVCVMEKDVCTDCVSRNLSPGAARGAEAHR